MGHTMDIHFSSLIWCHFYFAFLSIVFFASFSAVGRPFYVVCGDFERNILPTIICWFRERIESEDYVANSDQFPILRVP